MSSSASPSDGSWPQERFPLAVACPRSAGWRPISASRPAPSDEHFESSKERGSSNPGAGTALTSRARPDPPKLPRESAASGTLPMPTSPSRLSLHWTPRPLSPWCAKPSTADVPGRRSQEPSDSKRSPRVSTRAKTSRGPNASSPAPGPSAPPSPSAPLPTSSHERGVDTVGRSSARSE